MSATGDGVTIDERWSVTCWFGGPRSLTDRYDQTWYRDGVEVDPMDLPSTEWEPVFRACLARHGRPMTDDLRGDDLYDAVSELAWWLADGGVGGAVSVRAPAAQGNGTETYRRALTPGRGWRFVASHRLPRGTFLAADRRARVRGDVYVGDLVADYDRSLRHGASRGEAQHDGKVGLVVGTEIEWMDVVRQKDGMWHVILPTGAHLTIPSAAWR